MKKVFGKNIWLSFGKKILIAIMIILSTSTLNPPNLAMAKDDDVAGSLGGKLAQPVTDFALAIGDSLYDFVSSFLLDTQVTTLKIDISTGGKVFRFLTVIGSVLVAAIAAAALVCFAATGVGLVVETIAGLTLSTIRNRNCFNGCCNRWSGCWIYGL